MNKKQITILEQLIREVESLGLIKDKKDFLSTANYYLRRIKRGEDIPESKIEEFRASEYILFELDQQPYFREDSTGFSARLRLRSAQLISNIKGEKLQEILARELQDILEGVFEKGCEDDSRCENCDERRGEPMINEGYC